MYDLVRKIVEKEINNLVKAKNLLVSLLHCLYEAEDSSLCLFVADLLHHNFSLRATTLSPLDCLSVGFFLAIVSTTVSCDFTVNLGYCSIGDQGCKFLVQGIFKCVNTHSNITSQLRVNLEENNIHEGGLNYIGQVLKDTTMVCELNLSKNPIGEGGLKMLCETLSTNNTLKGLNLYNCESTISEVTGYFLGQLLSTNSSLSYLLLWGNRITDCHHIMRQLDFLIIRHYNFWICTTAV